jgi:formylglycine-generating enzyme required for sulfatase activity
MPQSTKKLPPWDQAKRDADLTLTLPGGIPMFFRRILPGSFPMGSRGESSSEEPIHRVVFPREFYLSTFVVTQEQYRAVAARCPALKKNPAPSYFKGPRRPVEQVSWEDATAFCHWLRRWKGLPHEIQEIRLPNEAEWEYAWRAGSETDYYAGDGEAALADIAWYDKNSGRGTHSVDERPESHPWGLYGMHGNVWEWCLDVFDPHAYRKREDGWMAGEWTFAHAGADALTWESATVAEANALRVLRGGSWSDPAGYCRSAFRFRYAPDARTGFFGFRVCLVRGPAGQTDSKPDPAPGDGGRGTRQESDGAGGAGEAAPDSAQANFPAKRGKISPKKPKPRPS